MIDILKLAEKAGFFTFLESTEVLRAQNGAIVLTTQLTRFAELIAQSAYEDAAKLCDELIPRSVACEYHEGLHDCAIECSEAIRNRANEVTK